MTLLVVAFFALLTLDLIGQATGILLLRDTNRQLRGHADRLEALERVTRGRRPQ